MIRYVLRSLSRSPGYAILVVATLATGIGASTAVYGIVDSVLVDPLPYPDADQLVRLVETVAPEGSFTGRTRTYTAFSVNLLPALNVRLEHLAHLAGYASDEMTLTGAGPPSRLAGASVSFEIFPLLGVVPALGRAFGPDDEARGAGRVLVLSDGLWRSRFGGQEDALGQSLTLDGQMYTIVGILPPGLSFPDPGTDFWIPLYQFGRFVDAQGVVRQERHSTVPAIARLESGVSPDVGGAEVAAALGELRRESGSTLRSVENVRIGLVRSRDELAEPVRPALLVLAGAAGLVLLVACANVVALGLARMASRAREMAIRAALGGGRRGVVGPGLVESLILAVVAGGAGILLARVAVGAVGALGVGSLARPVDIELDRSALGFALALSLMTGVAVGLAGTLGAWKTGVNALIQEGASAASSELGLLRRYRARGVLVLAQIVLTMVLLVSAGLLIRSFLALAGTDPGYDASRLLAFQVSIPSGSGSPLAPSLFPRAFAEEFLARMESSPDIASAGFLYNLPTAGVESWGLTNLPVPPGDGEERPGLRIVSSGLFRAMGVDVVAGREFTPGDAEGQPRVLMVNETLVRRYFGGESPVGRIVRVGGYDDDWEVAGVVEDLVPSGLGTEPGPEWYLHLGQAWVGWAPLVGMTTDPYFVVRANGDPAALVSTVRRILEDLEPTAALSLDVRTMEERLWASVTGPRFYAVTLGSFAGVALLLAAVGLFSVLAHAVTDGTRAIGIRMALGADRRSVLGGVFRQAGILAGIGIGLGLAVAVGTTRFLEGMLFGLTPLDPVTFVAVPVLLLAVVAAATWVPARRATRVDPMVALRHE